MNSQPLKTDRPIGLLNPFPADGTLQHKRYLPSSSLSDVIEHYWYVSWDLSTRSPYQAEQSFSQAVLTHPSVHISMENQQSQIYGVQREVFIRRLQGKSQVLGIKFKPGGFYPYYRRPMHSLTDQRCSTEIIVCEQVKALIRHCSLELAALDAADTKVGELINKLDRGLSRHQPQLNNAIINDLQRVNRIIDVIKNSPTFKVNEICQLVELAPRPMQRLCQKMIGVTPKWLINRYRMHWIAEKLKQGYSDWNAFVDQFSYTDQAHFINDFKKHIGKTPGLYIRSVHAEMNSHAQQ